MHSIELATPDTTYYPLDLNLEVKMNEESILARTNAGNLWLQFHSDEGMDSLLKKTDAFIQNGQESSRMKQNYPPDRTTPINFATTTFGGWSSEANKTP